MKVVIAPDSFKESMSASQAAAAMSAGVRSVVPDAECIEVPMSDGGEGFARAISSSWDAAWVEVATCDALRRELVAGFGLHGERAVMDMASSAGLELIDPADRDVLRSSTRGLGIMMREAVDRGARQLLIGIGGSATNDGGAGMLRELGARLMDADGHEVGDTVEDLRHVAHVDASDLEEMRRTITIKVACDVTNPLTGPRGATAVFGPQKGVTADRVRHYDAILARFAEVSGHGDVAETPGAGAAGGLGFALMAFLDADLQPGVELVSDAVGLGDEIERADYVLTGEGSVDDQTLDGKTPAGVAALAAGAGVPVLLFAGKVKDGAEVLLDHGVTELVQIVGDDIPLEEALAQGARNLERAVYEAFRSLSW